MSATALVWWLTLAALVAVLVLAGLQVARALGEVRRLKHRVADYADLPVLAPVRNAERNIHRLEGALSRIDPLMTRAGIALERVRRGPIPPDSIAGARRVLAALAKFRTIANR